MARWGGAEGVGGAVLRVLSVLRVLRVLPGSVQAPGRGSDRRQALSSAGTSHGGPSGATWETSSREP